MLTRKTICSIIEKKADRVKTFHIILRCGLSCACAGDGRAAPMFNASRLSEYSCGV